ncbi:MAG: hypothetical protein D6698_12305, partial [Gammaproteobacteria bacterium]
MPSKYYVRNFQKDHYYHIYNRGVARQEIFRDDNDYQTFLKIIQFYYENPNKNKFQLQSKRTVLSKEPFFKTDSSFHINAFCL